MNTYSAFLPLNLNAYSIALLLHVAGALGMAVVLGREWSGLWLLQRATSAEQMGSLMSRFTSGSKIGLAFIPITGISGSYLMMTKWAGAAWGFASVGSLLLVIALTVTVTGPRMKAIGQALASVGGLEAPPLNRVTSHPLLWVSVQTRAAVIAAMVVLKLVKPGAGGSLLMIGVAILVGAVSALLMPTFRKHARRPPAPAHNS